MTLTTTDISNRYNLLFNIINEGATKTFSEMSNEEISYIIFLLGTENSGGGGGISSTVSVSNFPSTQPISGNVGITSLPSLPVGSNNIGTVSVNNFPSSQAVSGTVSLGSGNNSIGAITNTSFASSQSGTWNLNNITGTISLPTNAANQTLQTTGNTSLASLVTTFTRPTITYVSGTISTSGDNTIVSAPGSGLSIYVTKIILQNESSNPTTIIVKDGTSIFLRCYTSSSPDGIAIAYPERREDKLNTNAPLIINLSGANSVGYSIGYFTGA